MVRDRLSNKKVVTYLSQQSLVYNTVQSYISDCTSSISGHIDLGITSQYVQKSNSSRLAKHMYILLWNAAV